MTFKEQIALAEAWAFANNQILQSIDDWLYAMNAVIVECEKYQHTSERNVFRGVRVLRCSRCGRMVVTYV